MTAEPEKTSKNLSGWKTMGAHTRVYFLLAMVLIGFGAVGLIASLVFTNTSWIDNFYSGSLYSNTVGVVLLLIANIRILKERERAKEAERTARLEEGDETDDRE